LGGIEMESLAVLVFIAQERGPVAAVVERVAHLVERIAALRGGAVEDGRAPDFGGRRRGESRVRIRVAHGRSMALHRAMRIRKATYRNGPMAAIDVTNSRAGAKSGLGRLTE
jgi:hypothetical protein